MSDSRILRLRAAALLAVILLAPPTLAGCAALPIPSIGGGDSGTVDEDLVGSVPADFPSEIPLIEGDVLSGVSLGSGSAKVWSVLIKVDDGSAFERISAQLEEAGFVASGLGGTTELGSTGTFTKPPYAISLAVSSGSDEGWVAKYTVAGGAS